MTNAMRIQTLFGILLALPATLVQADDWQVSEEGLYSHCISHGHYPLLSRNRKN